MGVANDLREVAEIVLDGRVDSLLDGVGVEIVAHGHDFVRRPDSVDSADALLDPHEIPRHVVVEQPSAALQVESLTHAVGAEQDADFALAKELFKLVL